MIYGLTYLWYSRATNIIINRNPTNHYGRMMRYNKVEYSSGTGVYCMTHDVKLPFFYARVF